MLCEHTPQGGRGAVRESVCGFLGIAHLELFEEGPSIFSTGANQGSLCHKAEGWEPFHVFLGLSLPKQSTERTNIPTRAQRMIEAATNIVVLRLLPRLRTATARHASERDSREGVR